MSVELLFVEHVVLHSWKKLSLSF